MLAQVNGINLHYNDIGDSQSSCIVLVHGFPFSSAMWNGQARMLGETNKLRVITYDLRGHGDSQVGDGQYSIEVYVDDLIALLDYLQVPKTILCGFSMGGYIALRAIERNPDRFSALVLCDTQSIADSNEAKIRRANSVKSIKKDGVTQFADSFLKAVFTPQTFKTRPDIVESIRKIVIANSATGICGALLAMAARTDTTEALSRINVPTLILVGENDTVTPPSVARIMQDKITGAKLHVIDNAGHMSNLENAVSFNHHLAQFVLAAK